MIRLVNVTNETFDKVYEKMVAAFPYEERRDYIDQKKCFDENECFKIFEIYDNDVPVGFISPWVFSDFVFIEHIAIDSDRRSGGYGSKTIELIKSTYKKPVILEAEAPVTEQQIKRIRFYDRLGFKTNNYDYCQPSYHGSEGVPLKILSFPKTLSQEEFYKFLTTTREFVYKLK